MPQILQVHLLPELTTTAELDRGTVVVIDVLRACTTITTALHAGAKMVVPCTQIEETRRKGAQFADGEAVLGGERRGVPIEGFDLGNSPVEYSEAAVSGKTVLFTTTNGTRAMQRCGRETRICMGAFVNVSAVVQALQDCQRVHLLCSGTNGEITREDVLLSGMIVARLQSGPRPFEELNDEARIARDCWLATFGVAQPSPQALATVLEDTLGGRNLTAIGFASDVEVAAQVDRFSQVAWLNREVGGLVLGSPTAAAD